MLIKAFLVVLAVAAAKCDVNTFPGEPIAITHIGCKSIFESEIDDWSRILVVRYPSRRAFFRLVSDPEYLKFMPYKLAALKLALVPVSAQVVTPDLRLALGGLLLVVFLAVGWVRSARSSATRGGNAR